MRFKTGHVEEPFRVDGEEAAGSSLSQETRVTADDADDEESLLQLCASVQNADLRPCEKTFKYLMSCLNAVLGAMENSLQDQLEAVAQRLAASKSQYSRLLAKGYTTTEKFFHLLYVMPYFRDRQRFIPSANPDAAALKNLGVVNMLATPRPCWSSNEVSLLSYAVKHVIKNSLLSQLSDRLRIATDKMTELLNSNADDESRRPLSERIESVNKEIGDVTADGDALQSVLNDPNSVNMVEWEVVAQIVTHGQKRRHFNIRSEDDCRQAWAFDYAPWINKTSCSQDEMDSLLEIGAELEWRDWDEIAKRLGTNRTAFECARLYMKAENEKKKCQRWSAEEDQILLKEVNELRTDEYVPWKLVALSLPNRNAYKCRNRYAVLQTCRGRWKPEEDKLLLQAIQMYGNRAWTRVAVRVPGRTPTQCRTRYTDCFSKVCKLQKWTKLEDSVLKLGISVFGCRWVKISQLLSDRSANQVKMRYRALSKGRGRARKKTYMKQLDSKYQNYEETTVQREALVRQLTNNTGRQDGDVDDSILSGQSLDNFLATLEPNIQQRLRAGLAALRQQYSSSAECDNTSDLQAD